MKKAIFFSIILTQLTILIFPLVSNNSSPAVYGNVFEMNSILSAERVIPSSRLSAVDQTPVLSYPSDPTNEIPWSAGTNGVADIQAAFNNARQEENSQLGTSLPMVTLPGQFTWDGMSDGEKALWLINRERIDRGVTPLADVETNVTQVAQYYADFLLNNNAWGHTADGRSPWERLNDNPAIGACHDSLNIAENIAVFVSSGSNISLPLERSIYMFLYEDKDCCGWGHRHAILWDSYNDNSGDVGKEGFLGIGRAAGGPYQGPFSQSWPHAEMIVMNVFDPCADWISTSTSFIDVPSSHPYFEYIEALYANGLTNGCSISPPKYCPDSIMNRAQVAKFFMTVEYGGSYLPPTDTLLVFTDDWKINPWAELWANDMYEKGLTNGCSTSPLRYCPDNQVIREQVAKFGLAIKYGNAYTPPPATGTVFADLTNVNYWATAWAEQAYAEGLIFSCGTDTASGKPKFCPYDKVDRGFAAYVIVTATGLLEQ